MDGTSGAWSQSPTPEAASGAQLLRGALEPLFDPGAGDDRVPVAEPDSGAKGAVLVPEVVELRVDAADVRDDAGVVFRREPLVQLGAVLAQTIDFLVDLVEGPHGGGNAVLCPGIPQE